MLEKLQNMKNLYLIRAGASEHLIVLFYSSGSANAEKENILNAQASNTI